MTILEMRQKREAYLRTAQNVLDKAITEDRSLTDAEESDITGLRKKATTIEERLKFAEPERAAGPPPAKYGLEEQRSAANEGSEQSPFKTLGEQLRAVVTAGQPGQRADQRLFEVRNLTGMGEGLESAGGFLLQNAFSYALLQEGLAASTIASKCRQFPIPVNASELKLPAVDEKSRVNGSRWGGISLAWGDEASEIIASKPKLRQLTLAPKRLTGLVYLSEEITQDSTVLDAFVRMAFSREFAFVVDDSILRGSGAGMPLGILVSGATVEVPKIGSQPNDTILFDNCAQMLARLPASSVPNAIWLYSQSALPQLLSMTIAVKNIAGTDNVGGSAAFLPSGGTGVPNRLLGLPAYPIEQASELGKPGDLILFDPTRYILSTRGDLQIASSMHVRFLYLENCIRFAWRLDGMPELNSSVTPFKGSDAQSPYVTLAER
jgi:HK97 family phage major capsid protein